VDDKSGKDHSTSIRDPGRRDEGSSLIHSEALTIDQPKRSIGHRERREVNQFDLLVNKHAQGSEALKDAQLSEHLQNKFKEFYMIRNVISSLY
jgi:hypothetical protein